MKLRPRVLALCALPAALAGCVTRVVEVRAVAPVAELPAAPVYPRGVAMPSAPSVADEPAGNPGVRVEAVIPGMSSGRSLSIEPEPKQQSTIKAPDQ